MRSKVLKHVLTITLSYLIIGVLYIAFSDKIVHSLSLNEEMLTRIQTLKGWGFILLTSIWLFVLLHRYFNNLEKEKNNLKSSEEKWRSLVTNSPDYIALLDKERKFLFVNKYPDGFTSEQVIGKDSIEYFSDENKEQFKEIFQKCFDTKTTQKFEVKAFGDNHSIRHYEEFIVPLLSDDDITFLVIARDITDRKLFEIKLKESEERWRTLVTSSPDYIALLDNEGKFLFLNNYSEGFGPEKVIGTDSLDYFSDEYKETYKKIFKYCSETKTTQKFEYKGYGDNYSLRHYEEFLVPIPAADNKLNFLAIARDITDRIYFEDALKASEEKYRTLIENTQEAIYIAQDGKIKYVNQSALNITGRSESELLEHEITEFVPAEDFDFAREHHSQLISGEVTESQSEYQLVHSEGNYVDLLVNSVLIQWEGRPATLNFASDITERKQFENALTQSEAKYRSLFENMSEGLAYCKMVFENDKPVDFIYLSVNPRFKELTGLKEVEGKYVTEIIPGIQKENPELFEIYGRVSMGGTSESFETFVPGLNEWFSVSVYCPHIEHFVAVFTVITVRKQAELALQKNRRFLADLIENSGALIYVKDLDGRYELVNKKWEEITGLNRRAVLGKTDDVLFSKADAESFRDNDLAVINSDETIETEEVLTNENETRYFISNKFPTLDENGKINGICGVSTEITERKLAEKALVESEERFRNIVEGAPDAIFIRTEDKLVYLNPAACSLFGIDSADELVGTPVFNLIHPEYRAITLERMKKIDTERKIIDEQYELRFLGKNGREGWVETKGEPIIYNDKKSTLVFLRDITARKKAEEALRLSEERYRTITENIKDVVWILDVQAEKFKYISPSVYQQRGYTVEEILEQPLSDALTAPEKYKLEEFTKDRVREFLLDPSKPTFFTDEVEQPCKNGSTIWTEIVTNYYINENTGKIEVRGVSRDITEKKKIQDALRDSEQRFRTTLDNMLEGCQILDSNWTYTYINDAAEKQNHRPKSELLGNEYVTMWPGIEHTRVYRLMKDCMQNRISHQFENEFTYPDGSVGWFDLSIQPVPEGIFILSIDITEKKKAELEILNSRENLRALYARLQRIREEERINLSRELHDHLGQNLTGLKMDVAYIAKHIALKSEIDTDTFLAKTTGMSFLIDDLIKNVRKISSELRPNVLDYLGLVPAIEWYVEDFKRRTEMECIYTSNTQKIDLSMEINSSIFRIIQEAFTNIIRHAHASIVKLTIDEHTEFIKITIHDNGIGIDPNILNEYKSLGILGMKERTLNFKGKLNIVKAKEGGTTLTLIIPKR